MGKAVSCSATCGVSKQRKRVENEPLRNASRQPGTSLTVISGALVLLTTSAAAAATALLVGLSADSHGQ